MNRKTLYITGAVLVFGAVLAAVAVAQSADNEKAKVPHECTPEMMENMGLKNGSAAGNMTQSCTPEMMNSKNCENMADTAMVGCGSMMSNMSVGQTKNHMTDPNHCSGSDMGSMMGNSNRKGSMMSSNKGSMM